MNESNSNDELEIIGHTSNRLISIDFFKGITIILMIFANTVGFFDDIPFGVAAALGRYDGSGVDSQAVRS